MHFKQVWLSGIALAIAGSAFALPPYGKVSTVLPIAKRYPVTFVASSSSEPAGCGIGNRRLHLTNEDGSVQPEPFEVPKNSVLVVTDAAFGALPGIGFTYAPGDQVEFSISSIGAEVARFGGWAERVEPTLAAGEVAFESGATFAASSSLCARFRQYSNGVVTVNSPATLRVHGYVIDYDHL